MGYLPEIAPAPVIKGPWCVAANMFRKAWIKPDAVPAHSRRAGPLGKEARILTFREIRIGSRDCGAPKVLLCAAGTGGS
jgi:hypothetical protein